jgi:hypothetical protein
MGKTRHNEKIRTSSPVRITISVRQ